MVYYMQWDFCALNLSSSSSMEVAGDVRQLAKDSELGDEK